MTTFRLGPVEQRSRSRGRGAEQAGTSRGGAAVVASLVALLGLYPVLVLVGVEYLAVFFICVASLGWFSMKLITNAGALKLPILGWIGLWTAAGGIIYSNYGTESWIFDTLRDIVIYLGPIGVYVAMQTVQPSMVRYIQKAASVLFVANLLAAVLVIITRTTEVLPTLTGLETLSQRPEHSFGAYDHVLGMTVSRPSAFLTFPTTLAIASILLLALRGKLGPCSWIMAAMMASLTVTRTAFIVAVLGLITSAVLGSVRSAVYVAVVSAGFASAVVLVIRSLVGSTTLGDDIVGRSVNSNATRLDIYRLTLAYWQQFNGKYPFGGLVNPVLIPEYSPFPLGSHSMYLGLIFRYGLIGIAGIVCILVSISSIAVQRSRSILPLVLGVGTIFIVEDFTLDPVNWVLLFAVLGLWSRSSAVVSMTVPRSTRSWMNARSVIGRSL